MKPVFVLNGPNLNLLGLREPAIYGTATLKDVAARCHAHAATLGLAVDFRQSNHEGELVSWVHEARDGACGIAINAGAYTHTSVALHDALKAADLPSVELHLSNVHKREAFRHHSFLAPAVTGVICGFGVESYVLALSALHSLVSANKKG
ncbi:type II 3-dehydroquinate dehydratase [Aestuariivirga litoralis]|uniref:3-dehydroquinate dehydratase n=1 Tax=Aestuariivirga litoralis TaxID=2650924 RepID=A0A2W2AUD5_9HYPH|nr:type II 3-dehydroquinate dehydratase [Aestuariivirga litoralis]PZF76210.1 type II 3-dehydroquinate dehydratase [Aestuariivirga litoralis]